MKAKLIGWTAAGLAGVGVFAGVANAAVSSGPSASSSAAPSSAAHVSQRLIARVEHRLLAGAAHGEIVLDTKNGVQTIDFQRGTTSNVTNVAVTVTDKTGAAESWGVSSTTKIRERGSSSPQLANGESVVVVGVRSGGTLTARLVVIVPARTTSPTSDQATA